MESITNFDFSVLDALQKIHSPVLNVIMAVFTYLGDAGILWIFLSLVFLRVKKTRQMGAAGGLSLVLEVFISELMIKHLVRRTRPFVVHDWIDTIVHKPSSYSFPSGHTCTSFCFSTAVFCFNRKLGLICYAVSAVIGFSRLYFYIHYPTDVLCGALEGVILGATAAFIVKRYAATHPHKDLPDKQVTASEDR